MIKKLYFNILLSVVFSCLIFDVTAASITIDEMKHIVGVINTQDRSILRHHLYASRDKGGNIVDIHMHINPNDLNQPNKSHFHTTNIKEVDDFIQKIIDDTIIALNAQPVGTHSSLIIGDISLTYDVRDNLLIQYTFPDIIGTNVIYKKGKLISSSPTNKLTIFINQAKEALFGVKGTTEIGTVFPTL